MFLFVPYNNVFFRVWSICSVIWALPSQSYQTRYCFGTRYCHFFPKIDSEGQHMDYPQMQTNISTAINDIYKTAFFFQKINSYKYAPGHCSGLLIHCSRKWLLVLFQTMKHIVTFLIEAVEKNQTRTFLSHPSCPTSWPSSGIFLASSQSVKHMLWRIGLDYKKSRYDFQLYIFFLSSTVVSYSHF